MKKSVKAALWSGLGFPGVGQFILKRYERGLIIFIPALVSGYFYLKSEYDQASILMLDLKQRILNGDIQLDLAGLFALSEKLDAQISALPPNLIADTAFWVFVVCWVLGIVDAYLLGQSMELPATSTKST